LCALYSEPAQQVASIGGGGGSLKQKSPKFEQKNKKKKSSWTRIIITFKKITLSENKTVFYVIIGRGPVPRFNNRVQGER